MALVGCLGFQTGRFSQDTLPDERADKKAPVIKVMKTSEKTDSTSTPLNNGLAVAELPSPLALDRFPVVVNENKDKAIRFGSRPPLVFPVGNGENLSIDPALLRGKGTRKLVNIKVAMTLAGYPTKEKDAEKHAEGVKWFNTEVRDVWHKILRFAAKNAMQNGKPTSLGLSTRTLKDKTVILTSKHGFEYTLSLPDAKAIADKAAKQSKKRAKRQARKANRNKPLANPVIPENNRVNALVNAAEAEAAKPAAA